MASIAVRRRIAAAVVVASAFAGGKAATGVQSRPQTAPPFGPFAFAVAVDATAGRVFVVGAGMDNRNGGPTGPGHVAVLDARDGALLRTVAVGQGSSLIAVAGRASRAVVGNQGRIEWYQAADGTNAYRSINPSLSVLDTRTGAVLRRVTLGGQVPYALVIDERRGRVIVAPGPMPPNMPATSGYLRAIDTRTGAALWATPLHAVPPLQGSQLTLEAAADRVFVALTDFTTSTAHGVVRVVDARTGAPLSDIAAGPGPTTLAVDGRLHHLYVGEGAGTLRILNARTGALVRTVALGSGPAEGLGVDERAGHIFTYTGGVYSNSRFTGNGMVRTIDGRTGRVVRTVPVGLATGLAVDATAGRALVLNRGSVDSRGHMRPGGTVSVVATRSGLLLHATPVGPYPAAVAVDERTGRAFVMDIGARISVLDTRSGTLVRTMTLVAPSAHGEKATYAPQG